MKALSRKQFISFCEIEHRSHSRGDIEHYLHYQVFHPFLASRSFHIQTSDKFYYFDEYVSSECLLFESLRLRNIDRFSEEDALFYSAQIFLALEYLHNLNILFLGLEGIHVWLTSEGYVKLSDYGISKSNLVSNDDSIETFGGDPVYLAPEILEGLKQGIEVDYWAFGILIYKMLTGSPPFENDDVQELYHAIVLSDEMNIPQFISEAAQDFLVQLLNRKPQLRLSNPLALKQHRWFQSISWQELRELKLLPPFLPTPVLNSELVGRPLKSDVRDPWTERTDTVITRSDFESPFDGFTFD